MSMSELKMYTWDEIAKHDKEDDCWVVLYDKVLEMTEWMHKHPGGLDPIKDMGGMDITSSFESIGHSSAAQVISKSYIIGRLDPTSKPKRTIAATETESAPKKWSEMNRDELRKYKAGGEIIPLWVIVMVVLVIAAIIYMLF